VKFNRRLALCPSEERVCEKPKPVSSAACRRLSVLNLTLDVFKDQGTFGEPKNFRPMKLIEASELTGASNRGLAKCWAGDIAIRKSKLHKPILPLSQEIHFRTFVPWQNRRERRRSRNTITSRNQRSLTRKVRTKVSKKLGIDLLIFSRSLPHSQPLLSLGNLLPTPASFS
jgi:hypothetical protein